MAKITKRFEFLIPLSETFYDNGRQRSRHIGDLAVSGVAYFYTDNDLEEAYSFDIDVIKWQNTDVLDLYSNLLDGLEFSPVWNAASNHIENIVFINELTEKQQKEDESNDVFGNLKNDGYEFEC